MSFRRPSKIFSAVALGSHLCLVVVGIAWWIVNLGTIPAYGDTSQYFHLATTLHVDQYRTLFYPLLLRGLLGIARLLNTRIELAVYLLQTAAALLSVTYLLRALWDVSTRTERFAFLTEVAPTLRRLVIGAAVIVVCTEPLVTHFALSVMTDSLATSFTTVGVAALVRIAALGDVRLRTGLLGWLSIAAAGFMRAEKVWVFTLVVGATLAALAVLGRWPIPFRSQQSGRLSFRVSVLLATLLLTPSLIVLTVNGATQKADYGWPPLTASVRLFVRTAWPRLVDIRPLLSEETQAIVSAADASAFDGRYNEYLSLVPRLRRSAGGTDRLVNEISFTALRHRGVDIAIATTIDALRYMVPMIAYPVDLMLAARTASSWTASRMSMAHPTLTRIYLATATVLLLAIQLPLLLYALASREKGHSAIVIAALLIIGTALVNAILYAVGNGLQNVRYALPAYVLVYSAVVWSNAAVLARRPTTGRLA